MSYSNFGLFTKDGPIIQRTNMQLIAFITFSRLSFLTKLKNLVIVVMKKSI